MGGATGFFAYEAANLFERLPEPKGGAARRPEIDLWFHDVGVAFDAVERRAFLVSTGWPEDDPTRRRRRAHERLEWLKAALAAAPARLRGLAIAREAWRPNMSPQAFRQAVEATREYIAAGDIFQANLTLAWHARLQPGFDPLALYDALASANPAPFGAFIATPERLVASTSPEAFLLLSATASPRHGPSRERSPVRPTEARIAASPRSFWPATRTVPRTS